MEEAKLYTDGGSRGNPGQAAYAYVICNMDGSVVEKSGKYMGITTNNQAEYQGLVAGLTRADELGVKSLQVYMDSELIIRQLNGQYKIKNALLLPFYSKSKELSGAFTSISFTHVPRALNQEADREVNRLLDEASSVNH